MITPETVVQEANQGLQKFARFAKITKDDVAFQVTDRQRS